MTPRPPVVVGLQRGVGTSTVATALHGLDDGLSGGLRDRTADIVVCGSDTASLALVDALVLAPAGPRPVLAITTGTTAPPRARLRALEERFGTMVLLPEVARWHGLVRPSHEVGTLLAQPVEHLPRPMRSYACALRHLAAAVLRSGQLDLAVPPSVGTPVPPTGPRPRVEVRTEVRTEVRPVLISAPRPVRPIVLAERRQAGRTSPPDLVPDLADRPACPVLDLDGPGSHDPDRYGPDVPELNVPELDDEAIEAAAWCVAGRAG